MGTAPLLGHYLLENSGALDRLRQGADFIAQATAESYDDLRKTFSPVTDRIPVAGPLSSYAVLTLPKHFWKTPALLLNTYDHFFDLCDLTLETTLPSESERFNMVARQLGDIMNAVVDGLLFTEPREITRMSWLQLQTDPNQLNWVQLNRDLTTTTLDSFLLWFTILPFLWEAAYGLAGPTTTALSSAGAMGGTGDLRFLSFAGTEFGSEGIITSSAGVLECTNVVGTTEFFSGLCARWLRLAPLVPRSKETIDKARAAAEKRQQETYDTWLAEYNDWTDDALLSETALLRPQANTAISQYAHQLTIDFSINSFSMGYNEYPKTFLDALIAIDRPDFLLQYKALLDVIRSRGL